MPLDGKAEKILFKTEDYSEDINSKIDMLKLDKKGMYIGLSEDTPDNNRYILWHLNLTSGKAKQIAEIPIESYVDEDGFTHDSFLMMNVVGDEFLYLSSNGHDPRELWFHSYNLKTGKDIELVRRDKDAKVVISQ
jgi:hypothetical protein